MYISIKKWLFKKKKLCKHVNICKALLFHKKKEIIMYMYSIVYQVQCTLFIFISNKPSNLGLGTFFLDAFLHLMLNHYFYTSTLLLLYKESIFQYPCKGGKQLALFHFKSYLEFLSIT